MANEKALEDIGFTKGEVSVYLSLLELGETTTGAIIKSSGITGSKVYEILDRLIKKGLVSYIVRERTKYFQAGPPRRLLDYVESKEKEISENKRQIESIIPNLEELRKLKENEQTSKLFEGYEGVKTVFNMILDTMNSGDEYYAFSLAEELKIKDVELFLKAYHRKRVKKNIKIKLIANIGDRSIFKWLSKLKGLEIRYLKNPVPLGVIVFGDYVATITFRDKPTAFLIKSNQISESYRQFFSYLWKIARM